MSKPDIWRPSGHGSSPEERGARLESERMSSLGTGACRRDMALIHCHEEMVLI
jgi:hypothetical protein